MTRDLPRGWTEAAIGDVAELQLGKMLDKARNLHGRAYPYLRNINVRWFAFDTSDLLEMRFEDDEAEKFAIADGDVLVCEGGEPGRAAVWRGGRTHLKYQKALHRVRPYAAVLPDWIALFLKHAADDVLLEEHFTGTTIKHLPAQALAAVKMPLPPLAEQRRIVARIEALFARTRRARAELGRVAALAPRYRAQVLATTFDADPEQGQGTIIADLAAVVFDGPFGSNLKSDDYSVTGVRVVRLENIGHLRFIAEKETFIPEPKAESLARHTLRPGDVLFSSFVDREVRVCVLPDDLTTAAINKADCFCIRVGDACLPEFLAYRLSTPATYEHMRETVHGATRPRISLAQLKQYRVDLPTVDVQRATVKAIASARASADKTEAEATRALALLDRLDAAILARAFRGELVPQDPADEPARLPSLPTAARPRRSRTAPPPAAHP